MPESDFEQRLHTERLEKLRQIAELGAKHGLSPAQATYPNSFAPSAPGWTEKDGALVPWLKAKYDSPAAPVSAEELEATRTEVAIAGRVMAIRLQGKAGFAQMQGGGRRLQIYVRKDDVGEDAFALYKLLDLGDHIGVTGYLMRTRTGELTVHVRTLTFLAKAMLALPDKFHGLEDTELRYRQRYVDLFVNPDVRDVFVKRAAILRAIRRFFDSRGYLEVETPMLHTIAGGAAARPFSTHHNALDIPLSLRIAPELYLKRLVVGGMDRVYEINRNFRNEGVSTQHNPEFTMLEFYQAYSNYHDLMDLTQELITTVAKEVNGTTLTTFNGHEIDLSKWQKLSMKQATEKFWPEQAGDPPTEKDFASFEEFRSHLNAAVSQYASASQQRDQYPKSLGLLSLAATRMNEFQAETDYSVALGKAIAETFEAVAEPHLIHPTIIYDFPLAVSPLSKVKPDEPDWVERFEFYIGGFEIGNAFSELNDPDDQRRRFKAQLEDRRQGDLEAMAEVDEDYVRALQYGLPPTAGEGIGIDRLTMILTSSKSIRDVILFPLMRPHKPTTAGQPEPPASTLP
ncbi:MAG: lysine--tRNA ligase [Acidobacteriota bacterium]|nr:lysine--tRNA ligase [Acidobacteriota bacterium]